MIKNIRLFNHNNNQEIHASVHLSLQLVINYQYPEAGNATLALRLSLINGGTDAYLVSSNLLFLTGQASNAFLVYSNSTRSECSYHNSDPPFSFIISPYETKVSNFDLYMCSYSFPPNDILKVEFTTYSSVCMGERFEYCTSSLQFETSALSVILGDHFIQQMDQ